MYYNKKSLQLTFTPISLSAKKIVLKVALFFIKTLLFLKKIIEGVFFNVVFPVLYFTARLFYKAGGKIIILKLYKIYRIIKVFFKNKFFVVRNKLLLVFGNRYFIHFLLILLAVFITTSNIKARQNKNPVLKFNQPLLINKVIAAGEFESGQRLREETLNIEKVSFKKVKSFYIEERKNSLTYLPPTPKTASSQPTEFLAYTPPSQRKEIIYYTVQPGDTVYDLAKKFNITANTIIWENNLNRYGFIKPGQKLAILPVTGVTYKVRKYDTIGKIAKKFNVSEEEILKINKITNVTALQIGQKLIIPGGRRYYTTSRLASRRTTRSSVSRASTPPPSRNHSATRLLWPIGCHRITQYYHWRHHAIDIACKYGTPIYAAEDGVIIRAGWSTGYGKNVVIDHGGGLKTLYGHCSKLYVHVGQAVNRGDPICAEGSTGWSTGPHVHFEVRKNNVKKNPLNYIR